MSGPEKYELQKEKELLLRIAEGDEVAFKEIMVRYSGLIHSFIYKHLQREELVKELVSDVFLHIWLTRETVGEIRNFGSYLFVLCRNQAFNALKKELREKKRNLNWFNDQDDSIIEEDDLSAQGISLIEQAIEQLAPQQKKVWNASRREGLTYEQIAGSMGVSKETVKSHLQAANMSIRKFVLKRMELLTCLLITQQIFIGVLPLFLMGVVHISN